MLQVEKGSQRVKLVAQAQRQSCNRQRMREGRGPVAMASVSLTDNQLSHVWEQLRAPPAGCSYLQDIFQIIRKYAKIAAHAFWASAERPWRRSGQRGRDCAWVDKGHSSELYELCPKDDDSNRLDSARSSTHCRTGSLHCTALCFCAAPLQRTSCSSL